MPCGLVAARLLVLTWKCSFFASKCALWCLGMGLGLAGLILWPYLAFCLLWPTTPREMQWMQQVVTGTYSLTEVLHAWPSYYEMLLAHVTLAWGFLGLLGLWLLGGGLFLWPFVAMFSCHCPPPTKEEA